MTTRLPRADVPGLRGDDLSVDLVGVAPVAHVRVAGELDRSTAPRLTRFVDGLVDDGCRQIDLDLGGVTFVAAAGLTAFREAAVRAERAGGRVRLVAVPPQVRRVLAITGLDSILEVHDGADGIAPCPDVAGRAPRGSRA